MAEAKKTTVTVQKPVEEARIVLTLTLEEAAVVRGAVGSVRGLGQGKHAYGIYSALSDRTIPSLTSDTSITLSEDPWS